MIAAQVKLIQSEMYYYSLTIDSRYQNYKDKF